MRGAISFVIGTVLVWHFANGANVESSFSTQMNRQSKHAQKSIHEKLLPKGHFPNLKAVAPPSLSLEGKTEVYSDDDSAVVPTPSGYLVAELFGQTATNCDGPITTVLATGEGICFVELDDSEEPVGSVIFDFDDQSSTQVNYTVSLFTNYDCTGSPSETNVGTAPKTCYEQEGDSPLSFYYTQDVNDLWEAYGPGWSFQVYDTEEECFAAGAEVSSPPIFAWTQLGLCMSTGNAPGEGPAAFAVTQCSNSAATYTQVMYEYSNCTDVVGSYTFPLKDCSYLQGGDDDDDDDDDYSIFNFGTMVCTDDSNGRK